MKKIISALALFFLSVNTFAGEGTLMLMKITTTKGATGDLKIYVCELGVRTEMDMKMTATTSVLGEMKIIALSKNDDSKKSYIINDEKKSYSVYNASDNKNSKKENVTVEKIGIETVNGFKCIHAKVNNNGEFSDIWTSKDAMPEYEKYKHIFEANQRNAEYKSAEFEALKASGCDGFPVKTVKTNSREGTTTMELQKVEKITIDKKLFEIPADYTEVNMVKAIMGDQLDIDKIMKMTPEERAIWQKEMQEKYGTKK